MRKRTLLVGMILGAVLCLLLLCCLTAAMFILGNYELRDENGKAVIDGNTSNNDDDADQNDSDSQNDNGNGGNGGNGGNNNGGNNGGDNGGNNGGGNDDTPPPAAGIERSCLKITSNFNSQDSSLLDNLLTVYFDPTTTNIEAKQILNQTGITVPGTENLDVSNSILVNVVSGDPEARACQIFRSSSAVVDVKPVLNL